MPIDSAEKRRSVAGIAFLPLTPSVTPNIAKDAEWRQQVGQSYSGISVSGNTGAVPRAVHQMQQQGMA